MSMVQVIGSRKFYINSMSIFQIHKELTTIEPEILFSINGFPISNSTFMLAFVTLTIFVLALVFRRKVKMIPGLIQGGIEMAYEALIDFMAGIIGNKEGAMKIFPVVGTLFVFILISNLWSLVPILNSLTFNGLPLFRAGTTDFNTTVALAVGSVLFLQFLSIIEWGPLGHIGRYIKIKEVIHGFKKGFGEGFLGIIEFFVGLVELIGEFSRIISLSFRLFGNMYAHELLAVIILGAFAYVVPALWSAMGILVGVIQTIVFASLITIYYSLQTAAVHDSDGVHE